MAAMLSNLEQSPNVQEDTEVAKDVAGIGFVGAPLSLHIVTVAIAHPAFVRRFRYGKLLAPTHAA